MSRKLWTNTLSTSVSSSSIDGVLLFLFFLFTLTNTFTQTVFPDSILFQSLTAIQFPVLMILLKITSVSGAELLQTNLLIVILREGPFVRYCTHVVLRDDPFRAFVSLSLVMKSPCHSMVNPSLISVLLSEAIAESGHGE